MINLLENIDLISSCILVNKITTEFEKKYIEKINKFYKDKYNNDIIIESNSVIEDFHIMKNAEILVCSLSTLSWCASLLSNKLKTCYMPDLKNKIGNHVKFRKPIENTIFYSI